MCLRKEEEEDDRHNGADTHDSLLRLLESHLIELQF